MLEFIKRIYSFQLAAAILQFVENLSMEILGVSKMNLVDDSIFVILYFRGGKERCGTLEFIKRIYSFYSYAQNSLIFFYISRLLRSKDVARYGILFLPRLFLFRFTADSTTDRERNYSGEVISLYGFIDRCTENISVSEMNNW